MYLQLIILAILILPIPIMYKFIDEKKEPYKVITAGIFGVGIGVLVLFIVAYFLGDSIGKSIEDIIDSGVTIITNNQEAMKTLGLEEISKAKAIALLKDAYRSIAAMIPAMLITWGAIISYIEYNILVRMKYKKIEGARPTAYIRNFSLKRENVIGWFIIYLGAYLFRFIGLEVAGIAVLNISIIVQSLIALQGTSVVFLIFYKRNINRILAAMLILMFWIMPMGKIGLFMLGAIDLLLNLRGKIN